jgi:hypothetical protein
MNLFRLPSSESGQVHLTSYSIPFHSSQSWGTLHQEILSDKNITMNEQSEILIMLGRIEGELVEIRKLNNRVSRLEICHAWLKGAWAAVIGLCAYVCRLAYER